MTYLFHLVYVIYLFFVTFSVRSLQRATTAPFMVKTKNQVKCVYHELLIKCFGHETNDSTRSPSPLKRNRGTPYTAPDDDGGDDAGCGGGARGGSGRGQGGYCWGCPNDVTQISLSVSRGGEG